MNYGNGVVLGIDYETASEVDLGAVGVDAYAAHPSTIVRCAVLILSSRSQPEIEKLRWLPGDDLPKWAEHALRYVVVLAHNATFEQCITQHVMARRYGWPVPATHRWRDSAQLASMMGLPTSLEGFARAAGLSDQKDMEGAALTHQLMDARVVPTREQQLRQLDYCQQDVRTMLAGWHRFVGAWHAGSERKRIEHRLIGVDRAINTRGVAVDMRLVQALSDIAARRARELGLDVFNVTGEIVSLSANAVKDYLVGRGDIPVRTTTRKKKDGTDVKVPRLDADDIDKLLEDPELPSEARRLLELRQEAGKLTSLAKLARLQVSVAADGRLRHMLRYWGAHTGRWTSNGVQLHNLPKIPKGWPVDTARKAAFEGDIETLRTLPGGVLPSCSRLLRTVFVAAQGYELIGADFSAIEARVVAWLAGAEKTLDVFRRGEDLYTLDARAMGSDSRDLGKVSRLSLGYGMGAVKYLGKLLDAGLDCTAKDARRMHQAWRKGNPEIVGFWAALEGAAHAVVRRGTGTEQVGHLTVRATPVCLHIELPSGRLLRYWRPRLRTVKRRTRVIEDDGRIVVREIESEALVFFTEAKNRRDMEAEDTYGGKLVENVTQAVARDLMAAALVRSADAGYSIVLHVHDSAAAEVPAGTRDLRHYCDEVLAVVPEWAPGLPVAADGYRSSYFRG